MAATTESVSCGCGATQTVPLTAAKWKCDKCHKLHTKSERIQPQFKPRARAAYVNPVVDSVLTLMYFGLLFALLRVFSSDLYHGAAFLALLPCCHLFFKGTKWFFKVFGLWLSGTILKDEPFGAPLHKSKNMKKWQDQSWQLAIHVSMTLMDWYVLADEPWWSNPDSIWEGPPGLQTHKESLRFMYVAQLAIWVYTCWSHRFWEVRRHDYVVMYIHHVSTIALVLGSYSNGCLRVGALILFLHDVSDIPVDILKMTNYLKLEGTKGLFIVEFAFVTNLACWAYTRLYEFPVRMIYNISLVALYKAYAGPGWSGNYLDKYVFEEIAYWAPCWLLLCLLTCLHYYWFYLFCRILYGIIRRAGHETGAEVYEGSSGGESEYNKEH